jgi:hypothetical protein
LLIGFGHRARQGKNTAADAILQAPSLPLETEVRMYAFADALKREVRVACGQCGGQYNLIEQFKDAGLMPEWVTFEEPKPRSLLQWWGTEYRRAKDPAYWVKRLRKTLEEHNPDIALITDVRFVNEVDFIHELGGYVVKCERLGNPDVNVREHPSEAVLDAYKGWDYHIKAATVAECKRQALDIFRGLWRPIEQVSVS